MGNFVSRLGPVTGYWVLIIAALILAKVFNWVDVENTWEMIKFVGMVTMAYLVLQGALLAVRKIIKK